MKFLVFGSLNIDLTFTVDHIVAPGETISSKAIHRAAGGKGANQAAALGKSGVPVWFAGKIGDDGCGVLDELRSFGVNVEKTLISKDIPTGQAIIQLDVQGQNSIILNAGGNKTLTVAEIEGVFDGFGDGDILILQNEINAVDTIIRRAKKAGMIVCLNPSPFEVGIRSWPLDLVDYFFVNEIEALQMTESTIAAKTDADFRLLTKKLLQRYSHARIILTAGKKGAYYAEGDSVFFADIVDSPVVDTTGAGDTFTGYFLSAIYNKLKPDQALVLASKASAIAVSRQGAMQAMPFRDEVYSSIARAQPSSVFGSVI